MVGDNRSAVEDVPFGEVHSGCVVALWSPGVDAYLGAEVETLVESKNGEVSLSWPNGVQANFCHPLPRDENTSSACDEPSRWLVARCQNVRSEEPITFGTGVTFVKEISNGVSAGSHFLYLNCDVESDCRLSLIQAKRAPDSAQFQLLNADNFEDESVILPTHNVVIRTKYNAFIKASSSSGTVEGRSDGREVGARWRLLHAALPRLPDWDLNRKGVITRPLPTPCVNGDNNIKELGSFPYEVQETLLLEDVLFVLMGVEGQYIKSVGDKRSGRSSRMDALEPDRALMRERTGAETLESIGLLQLEPHLRSPSAHPSLVQITEQMLPTADARERVAAFLEKHARFECGLVQHAFCSAISEIMQAHLCKIRSWEVARRDGSLTLAKLKHTIAPAKETFDMLAKLTQKVWGLRGGAVLNAIYKTLNGIIQVSNSRKLCEFLLQKATAPFLTMLSTWMDEGRIEDPYDEFFIREDSTILPQSMSNVEDYWSGRFQLVESRLPDFLAGKKQQLWSTGKYLDVLRSAKLAKIPGSQIDISNKKLTFTVNEKIYHEAIDRAHDTASQALLKLFLDRDALDLKGRLTSLKHFFFLGRADFFEQFLDSATPELETQGTNVNTNRLESLLDLAIRTSSTSVNQYKDDISCRMNWLAIEKCCSALAQGSALPYKHF